MKMAHAVETMAFAGQLPWHGLGARVDEDVSVKKMLEAAGLNWTLDKLRLQAIDDEVGGVGAIDIHDRFALVRNTDKRIMSICGKSWHPVQPADTIGFMREYVEAGGAKLETAGSLRGGKTVWGLAKLDHSFNVTKGDKVEGYLLITSPMEVGRSTQIRTTTVRVVCANTLAMAEGASELNYSQNHLTEFDVAAAKEAVGNAHEHLLQAESRYKTIAKMKINIEDAVRKVIVPVFMPEVANDENYADILLPEAQPKVLSEILDSMATAPGAVQGTGWGVLNGVTHWGDHVAGRNNATRMHRAWVGDISRKKVATEAKLFEMAA
jgi:phage/plasmid-like protein (TIGR03299 family)